MKFRNACLFLGRTDKLQHHPSVLQPIQKPREEIFVPHKVEIPGALWQAAAQRFVVEAQRGLACESAQAARQFLFDRGLSEKTIQAARVGFNQKTQYVPGELWGLESNRKIKLWTLSYMSG